MRRPRLLLPPSRLEAVISVDTDQPGTAPPDFADPPVLAGPRAHPAAPGTPLVSAAALITDPDGQFMTVSRPAHTAADALRTGGVQVFSDSGPAHTAGSAVPARRA